MFATYSPVRHWIFVAVFSVFTALTACTNSVASNFVSLNQARAYHEAGKVMLVDIRENSEHMTGVAKGSKVTFEMLKQQGYKSIRYVEGGMSQWAANGWPMVVPN